MKKEVNCPNCGSRLTGKIGTRHYYCWSCFVEFTWKGNRWEIYHLDPEGVPHPQGELDGYREATA